VPLLIDSPDYPPAITRLEVLVRVPLAKIGGIVGASYDGVTAALHINADLHAPLLCVADVFKVASERSDEWLGSGIEAEAQHRAAG
jgi:hypothetical protein